MMTEINANSVPTLIWAVISFFIVYKEFSQSSDGNGPVKAFTQNDHHPIAIGEKRQVSARYESCERTSYRLTPCQEV